MERELPRERRACSLWRANNVKKERPVHTPVNPVASIPRACADPACAALATARCFDCGLYLCQQHSVGVSLPTRAERLSETLCSSCLSEHLAHPDPFGPLQAVTAPEWLPGVVGQSGAM
jgi:hypothetical protein